jgi:opacity protein-like surface antigen
MRKILRLPVFLIVLTSFPFMARAGVLTGLDAMSATVLQKGQSSFSGIGLRARLHPEQLVKQVELMPSFEYWRNTSTVHPYGIHSMRKDATLALDARYKFSPKGWNPYVGAGFAVHFLSWKVDAPSLGIHDANDAVIKGSLGAIAGMTFGLSGRLDNFFELKYHHLTDYGQLKINWGLSYKM